MAEVDIIINNRTYRISCKDGEEDRIKLLSSRIDAEVKLLANKIGQLGEARMILLAALVLLEIIKKTANKIESVVNSINAERTK